MRRNGVPIRKYWLRPGLRVGITTGRSFTEIQACVAAGLDYSKWRSNEYPLEVRSEVVAWYELSQLISAHIESEKERVINSKSKSKSKN